MGLLWCVAAAISLYHCQPFQSGNVRENDKSCPALIEKRTTVQVLKGAHLACLCKAL